MDGTLVTSDATSPYSATWNAASASVGNHTVTGTAFDAAGNSAASSVQVTIVAPTPPPAGVKNVALAANGGAVTAYSHQFNERGYAQYVIDGRRAVRHATNRVVGQGSGIERVGDREVQ